MTTVLAATPSTEPVASVPHLPHRVWYYPAILRAASAARRDVTAQLYEWRLGGDLIDAAVLVVSELASNALVASLRAEDQHGDGAAAPSRVAVRLTYSQHHVIVEVWDRAADVPIFQAADPAAENGRGLHLIAALAQNSGCYQVRVQDADGSYRTNGKIAWAILPHTTSSVSPATDAPPDSPALPGRIPAMPAGRDAPDLDAVDLLLLQRVIDGLRVLDDWTTGHAKLPRPDPSLAVLPTPRAEALP